jgi:hypothetical protein
VLHISIPGNILLFSLPDRVCYGVLATVGAFIAHDLNITASNSSPEEFDLGLDLGVSIIELRCRLQWCLAEGAEGCKGFLVTAFFLATIWAILV